jgi:hypothetical protein
LAKKRQADLKHIARSPSPGSSVVDLDDTSLALERKYAYPCMYTCRLTRLSAESQYTYIYEDVGYETLAAYAEARLSCSVKGWEEDQIIAKLDVLENYQAPTMATPRIDSSVSS